MEIGLDEYLRCTALHWIKVGFNDVAGEVVVQEAASSFDDDVQGMWRRVCLYTHGHRSRHHMDMTHPGPSMHTHDNTTTLTRFAVVVPHDSHA